MRPKVLVLKDDYVEGATTARRVQEGQRGCLGRNCGHEGKHKHHAGCDEYLKMLRSGETIDADRMAWLAGGQGIKRRQTNSRNTLRKNISVRQ